MLTKLLEINQIGEERAGVLDIPEKYWPQPGQYMPCQHDSDPAAPLVTNLFRVIGTGDQLYLGPMPENWLPGDSIHILPPQGNGFSIPAAARRVGLLPFGVSPLRLLPLLKTTLMQNAALVLFWDAGQNHDILHRLPTVVEVAPTATLAENLDWLDYLAIDIALGDLPQLNSLLSIPELPFDGQLLIRTDMPCRGIGDCGVCAVKTTKGWQHACTDGPVFQLKELHHVAQ
ncbi:MAG: hypothetical protein P1P73_09335 [Brevefilum sp.]|nr:hypothetical protein [Brevefilum sp.]MDW7754726.1 hypothetical protein [Brevefilum sp.]